ncbi:MAG: energy coupling factor transporter S component ThiW [Bacillota bacterium]|nr:energy coupling factor transporter S component ThiW [Bacillota bacterium]
MNTRKLTYSAMLTAIGVATSSLIYIPVGASKCFPVQHLINVIGAVTLGPFYGVAMAFCISAIRNILGTGTLLAFPGSMIGALLAGLIYKYTKNNLLTVLGEIFGTGVLGALLAYPVAAFILGKKAALFAYILPFSISTIGGSLIAYILLTVLKKTRILKSI